MGLVRETVVVRREPLFDKTCLVCGRAFQGLRRRRYCSPQCYYRASYLRNAEERRAKRRALYQRQKAAQKRVK